MPTSRRLIRYIGRFDRLVDQDDARPFSIVAAWKIGRNGALSLTAPSGRSSISLDNFHNF